MKTLALALCLAAVAAPAGAQAPTLKPGLADLGFLVGSWSTPAHNAVQDTGGSATGVSHFTVEAGGGALLRRDHTDLYDAAGKPTGGFDIVMLIYAEGGAIRADYADGTHVIHFVKAQTTPGRSVAFTSAEGAGAPVFRLGYTLVAPAPATVAVAFSMAPPGGGDFRPIASGTLTRTPDRP